LLGRRSAGFRAVFLSHSDGQKKRAPTGGAGAFPHSVSDGAGTVQRLQERVRPEAGSQVLPFRYARESRREL
jgi:hypothetical protein